MVNRRIRVGVVGAGPTGLTTAILLRSKGVDVVLFERREGCHLLPQAHVVNTRTGEIFREIGVWRQMEAAAAPEENARYVTWCESVAGARYGRLEYPAHQTAYSPARTLNMRQDELEAILLEKFTTDGGAVKFGHEVVAVSEGDHLAYIDIKRPDGVVESAAFDYVVVADGANSVIRTQLGIEMIGPASLARFASCYFRADLDKHIADSKGPLYFIAGPDVRGVVIGFDVSRTWAFMCVIPPECSPADFNESVMRELVTRGIGDRSVELDILGVGSWNMSAQVAERFRKGRYLLAGDAAHRFPPTGGLGLNTGIQDAHNLAWKLSAIDRGEARDELLDTYESERLPIAKLNCEQSFQNAMRMGGIDVAIGSSTLGPVDPTVAQRAPAVSQNDFLMGNELEAQEKRRQIQDAIDAYKGGIDFLKIDIGYSYCEMTDNASQTEAATSYVPNVLPGSLLPHFWFNGESGTVSSLDILDRKRATLLVAAESGAWSSYVGSVCASDDLKVHTVPVDEDYRNAEAWYKLIDSSRDGVVLVRPDGHVAWSSRDCPNESSCRELASVMRALAGDSLS